MLNICVMEWEELGFVTVETLYMDIMFLIAVLGLYMSKLYAHFQVKEDDIWNDLDGHKLMEHVGSDNAINTYIKQKTMENIGKVLESRKNPQGYATVLEFVN